MSDQQVKTRRIVVESRKTIDVEETLAAALSSGSEPAFTELERRLSHSGGATRHQDHSFTISDVHVIDVYDKKD